MFNVYALSFLEATRFTANTRPDPRTQRLLDTRRLKQLCNKRLLRQWFNWG